LIFALPSSQLSRCLSIKDLIFCSWSFTNPDKDSPTVAGSRLIILHVRICLSSCLSCLLLLDNPARGCNEWELTSHLERCCPGSRRHGRFFERPSLGVPAPAAHLDVQAVEKPLGRSASMSCVLAARGIRQRPHAQSARGWRERIVRNAWC